MSSGGSPRQKMIGMMYLVLTALLAMNVSKDVLDAFIVVNEGLEKTNANFGKKNDKTYMDFKSAMAKDEKKTKPYYDLALKAQKISNDLVKHIDELKRKLIMETDKKPKEVADTLKLRGIDSKDNYDVPTHVLIGSEPGNPIKGAFTALELEQKFDKARKDFSDLFNDVKGAEKQLFLPNVKKDIEAKIGLETPDFGVVNGTKETWISGNFYHLPLAAVITNLSKMQADVKNAEADVINELMKSISGQDFKFDALVAKVIAPTSYVLLGQEYTADVFLAAFSSTSDPTILLGADTLKSDAKTPSSIPVSGGIGKFKLTPSSEGLQKWGGVIRMASPDGTMKNYPFNAEFMAAKPSLTVSAEKMNVLYTGVENPISVSVPGVPAENLVVTITQGSIPGSKGKYKAKVSIPGTKVKVNVSAKFGTETKQMGFFEFRVKKVPDPVATIAKLKGGVIPKGTLAVQYGIIPELENFDFDLRFNCIGYEYTFVPKGGGDAVVGKGDGPLSPELKSKIQNCRPGSKIYFDQIKVKGPDNVPRILSGTLGFTITN